MPSLNQHRTLFPRETTFTASPSAANGKIFALSEDGDPYVFAAGPEYKLPNSLDEMCMATPAIAGDRLLIRTVNEALLFEEGWVSLYCNADETAPRHRARS